MELALACCTPLSQLLTLYTLYEPLLPSMHNSTVPSPTVLQLSCLSAKLQHILWREGDSLAAKPGADEAPAMHSRLSTIRRITRRFTSGRAKSVSSGAGGWGAAAGKGTGGEAGAGLDGAAAARGAGQHAEQAQQQQEEEALPPMFCFETALKTLYWSRFMYEYEQITVRQLLL